MIGYGAIGRAAARVAKDDLATESQRLATLREECERHDRDPAEVETSVNVGFYLGRAGEQGPPEHLNLIVHNLNLVLTKSLIDNLDDISNDNGLRASQER